MFKLLVLTSFVVSLCCFMIGTALMFAIPSVAASGPWAGVSTFSAQSERMCSVSSSLRMPFMAKASRRWSTGHARSRPMIAIQPPQGYWTFHGARSPVECPIAVFRQAVLAR